MQGKDPKSIYIIGVYHVVQHLSKGSSTRKKELVEEFVAYLKRNLSSLDIQLIAEEFSTEALQLSNVKYSTAEKVADQAGLIHLFCDPTTEERNNFGIKRNDYAAREWFWADRLKSRTETNILFICGETHIASFTNLLQQNGYAVTILSRAWGFDFQDEVI
jgi:hypothetical protein